MTGRWQRVGALLLRRALVVLVTFAAAGALAGVLWHWVWTPPTGVAVGGEFLLDQAGVREAFTGTAWYALIAIGTGLLLGVVLALALQRWEVVTLVLVLLGSALAAFLMYAVGTALGPPDPAPVAAAADDLTPIPDDLSVSGVSPFLALPGGALVGLTVVFVGLAGSRQTEQGTPPEE